MAALEEGVITVAGSLGNQLLDRAMASVLAGADTFPRRVRDRLPQGKNFLSVAVELCRSSTTRHDDNEGVPVPVVEAGNRGALDPRVGRVNGDVPPGVAECL